MSDMNQKKEAQNIQSLLLLFMQNIILPFEKCMHLSLSVMQFRALCALSSDNHLKMTELAQRLCVSKQQVTQIVERMVEMGLVRRVENADDRRCILVEMTEQAQEFMREKCSDYTLVFLRTIHQLPQDTQKKFWQAADMLLEVLPQMTLLSQSAQDFYSE